MARRGPKPKQVDEVLRKDVFKRPDFLDAMPSKGQRGRAIALLSEKLKNMGSDETVVHNIDDFTKKFAVKNGDLTYVMTYIRTQLRHVYKINSPRVHLEESTGRIYIWRGHAK